LPSGHSLAILLARRCARRAASMIRHDWELSMNYIEELAKAKKALADSPPRRNESKQSRRDSRHSSSSIAFGTSYWTMALLIGRK
jgi:hypothetical protein